jgi:hypothetical protein
VKLPPLLLPLLEPQSQGTQPLGAKAEPLLALLLPLPLVRHMAPVQVF